MLNSQKERNLHCERLLNEDLVTVYEYCVLKANIGIQYILHMIYFYTDYLDQPHLNSQLTVKLG